VGIGSSPADTGVIAAQQVAALERPKQLLDNFKICHTCLPELKVQKQR